MVGMMAKNRWAFRDVWSENLSIVIAGVVSQNNVVENLY